MNHIRSECYSRLKASTAFRCVILAKLEKPPQRSNMQYRDYCFWLVTCFAFFAFKSFALKYLHLFSKKQLAGYCYSNGIMIFNTGNVSEVNVFPCYITFHFHCHMHDCNQGRGGPIRCFLRGITIHIQKCPWLLACCFFSHSARIVELLIIKFFRLMSTWWKY